MRTQKCSGATRTSPACLAIRRAPWLPRRSRARRPPPGEFLSTHQDLETSLYLSLGGDEVPKMLAALEGARARLRDDAGALVRWKAEVVAGADHQRNGEMATPLGFRALYCGWKPGAAEKPRLAPGACAN